MRLGLCYQCLKKLGRKMANGIFVYDRSMRQIAVVFGFEGKADEVRVHLPVCADCFAAPDLAKLKEGTKKHRDIQNFLKQDPKPVFKGFENDFVVGGSREEPEDQGEELNNG